MPSTKKKSSFASHVRDEVVQEHAKDQTEYGQNFSELPGGMDGVAQICEAKFDVFKSGNNEGEFYWYCAGSIVEVADTEKHGRYIGDRTSLTIPVCDTTNRSGITTPQSDHVKNIMNEMRKLDIPTDEVATAADLEDLCEVLLEAEPYFRFSTTRSEPTKEFPNPRTWHNWHGRRDLDGYAPPDTNGAVQTEEPSATEEPTEELSLSELAEKADTNDVPSQEELSKLALEAGVTQKDIDEASSWGAVAQMTETGKSSEEETETEDQDEGDEDWSPSKGDVVFYKPKGKRKAISCEVTAVYNGKETCNLKNLDDGSTIYKSVPWDKVSVE